MAWLPVSTALPPKNTPTSAVSKPQKTLRDPAYGFYAVRFGARPEQTATPPHDRKQQKNEIYALIRAIRINNMEDAYHLIDAGIDIHIQGLDGRTALMEAAIGGQSDLVRLLIRKNANLFALDDQGRSALMLAMQYNQINIAHILQQAIIDALKEILSNPHCPEAKRLMEYFSIG